MKEYLLWVETKEKDFNISYVRDENKTMDEMLNEIGEFIIQNHHIKEFVIKGVFKL